MLATPVRLGAATLLALVGLLLVPASAHACSCVAAGPAYHSRHAGVVFTGTVVGQVVSHPFWPTTSSGDPVTYRVQVDRVFKGRVGPVAPVRSVLSSASCGVEMAVGRRYVVFADASGEGALRADLCGGTRSADRSLVAMVDHRLGSPYPPDATIRLPESHLATTVWVSGEPHSRWSRWWRPGWPSGPSFGADPCVTRRSGPLHKPCHRVSWSLPSAHEPRTGTIRRGKDRRAVLGGATLHPPRGRPPHGRP